MKLLTYAINKKELTGVLNREGTFVYPLSAAGMEYRTMKEVIREIGPSELELLDHISGLPPYEVSNAAPLEDIKIMAPIPVPDQDIICLGINYLAHAEESARFKKEAFSKLLTRIHPGAIVLLHSTSQTNAQILDELLAKWEEMGYQFGQLDEL